jgi:hypothetical protein
MSFHQTGMPSRVRLCLLSSRKMFQKTLSNVFLGRLFACIISIPFYLSKIRMELDHAVEKF